LPEEVLVEKGREGEADRYEVKCEKCNSILAVVYRSGASYMVAWTRNCNHYKWETFGNRCWSLLPCKHCELGYNPDYCNKIYENAIKVLHNGTTVYVLVPNPF